MTDSNPSRRLLWIGILTLAAIVAVALLPRIPQDPEYHRFADQRQFLNIPNFANVVSNIVFVLVGALGLFFLWRQAASIADTAFINQSERWPYIVLFLGTVLTGFGSAYYHLAPNNDRLVWDRLPMTVIFMSWLSAVIAERLSVSAGLLSLPPLLAIGIGSVIYWHLSEQKGLGDLRPYGLVHFYPALLIPLMILLFPTRYTRTADLLGVLIFYALATIVEVLDRQIFAFGQIVSGHTLKHLLAATAIYWILRMLQRRVNT